MFYDVVVDTSSFGKKLLSFYDFPRTEIAGVLGAVVTGLIMTEINLCGCIHNTSFPS